MIESTLAYLLKQSDENVHVPFILQAFISQSEMMRSDTVLGIVFIPIET